MTKDLMQRRANAQDLRSIVKLLIEDDLGQRRENLEDELDEHYISAFRLIDADPNQYLMVVEMEDKIVGTCHLTIMPSMTFKGSIRMQIEAVRVAEVMRGKKIGQWMMKQALDYARDRGASIVQLTTNKKRPRAKHFYEGLGFEVTHEGMKLYSQMIL